MQKAESHKSWEPGRKLRVSNSSTESHHKEPLLSPASGQPVLSGWQIIKEARSTVFEYIEGWYSRKRIHSAIGYMTPQQKEDEELKKTA